jgi:hypothetical protein
MTPQSMRYTLSEVLSGMLAGTTRDDFTLEPERLASIFEDLAGRFELFAPFAASVDEHAVSAALDELARGGYIERDGARFTLTENGRVKCVGSKRTLFNRTDMTELEQASAVFEQL